jgi:hypothetical protein
LGEGGGDAVVVADDAADPHLAAPDRPGIAFTYVTDGGLTSPLELKRYRLFHAGLGSISSKPFARETEVKIQPEDHALGKNFAYR